MLLLEQLDLFLGRIGQKILAGPAAPPAPTDRQRSLEKTTAGRARNLEEEARGLLSELGTGKLAAHVSVTWDSRLRSTAGRAHFDRHLISLNPRLREHGSAEIDRTLRHELAHLLAQSRAGRRRIAPHGAEWRQACAELGIAGETRCHILPFPTQSCRRRFLYRCPKCAKEIPRVRLIRRSVACLECCRRFNRGRYDKKFRLRLVGGRNPE